jgi:hypothetical protein
LRVPTFPVYAASAGGCDTPWIKKARYAGLGFAGLGFAGLGSPIWV